MTPEPETFRFLGLCARIEANPLFYERLRRAAEGVVCWESIAAGAEHHGLEPLLLTHLEAAGVGVPPPILDRLRARTLLHAHAYAVRTRVMREVFEALAQRSIPVLVLKGAALAHLIYPEPWMRPARDVDLLVHERTAAAADAVLRDLGFSEIRTTPLDDHHHLPPLSLERDGARITVELHHHLTHARPFRHNPTFEEVGSRAQTFRWSETEVCTLSQEDMLWHVHAHGFAIDAMTEGLRLISVADLTGLVERWVGTLDWTLVGGRCGQAFRALPHLHHLTPWSDTVLATLDGEVGEPLAGIAPLRTGAWLPLLWPSAWWLGMCYGIRRPAWWLWWRFAGHPLIIAVEYLRFECGLPRRLPRLSLGRH